MTRYDGLRGLWKCGRLDLAVSHPRGAGDGLLSRGLAAGVPSALQGLTAVFGMGTGVAPTLRPPASLLADKACWLIADGGPRSGALLLEELPSAIRQT